MRLVRAVISGQAAVSPASVSCWPAVRRSGLVSRIRAARRGDRCGRSPSSAALVDVADEEVGAALVAAFPDLPQQLLDRDAGLFGPALAEVVAVGVDEGGPVLRDALQPLRFAGAVVALDGVEREVQAAGALEQAHVPGAQVVDLLPALQGGLGPLALLQGRALRPAGGVRRDFLPDGLAEAVPQVPAVADLHRAGQRLADRLAVGTRPVTAHDLDPGMVRAATSRRRRRCGRGRRRRAGRSRRR